MTATLEIPLFPLASVLFPAGRLGLRIFEPRYVAMTRACLRDSLPFGAVLIRAGFEVGQPAIPYEVGCTARIVDCQEISPDRFALKARGESVFRLIEKRLSADGLMIGRIELREPADPTPVPEQYATLAQMLRLTIERHGGESLPQPQRLDDAAWVGNRLAEALPMTPERRQQLLEIEAPLALLDAITRILKDSSEPQGRDPASPE